LTRYGKTQTGKSEKCLNIETKKPNDDVFTANERQEHPQSYAVKVFKYDFHFQTHLLSLPFVVFSSHGEEKNFLQCEDE
jgi:hypothetical protein